MTAKSSSFIVRLADQSSFNPKLSVKVSVVKEKVDTFLLQIIHPNSKAVVHSEELQETSSKPKLDVDRISERNNHYVIRLTDPKTKKIISEEEVLAEITKVDDVIKKNRNVSDKASLLVLKDAFNRKILVQEVIEEPITSETIFENIIKRGNLQVQTHMVLLVTKKGQDLLMTDKLRQVETKYEPIIHIPAAKKGKMKLNTKNAAKKGIKGGEYVELDEDMGTEDLDSVEMENFEDGVDILEAEPVKSVPKSKDKVILKNNKASKKSKKVKKAVKDKKVKNNRKENVKYKNKKIKNKK